MMDEGKMRRVVYNCSACVKEAAAVGLVEQKKTDGTTGWWIRLSGFIFVSHAHIVLKGTIER